jgi:hydrogenase expression/formation protein HypC
MRLMELSADGREGIVDMGGAAKAVGLDLVPEAKLGDFVLVHAGMAIQVIEELEAQKTLEVLNEFAQVPGRFEV